MLEGVFATGKPTWLGGLARCPQPQPPARRELLKHCGEMNRVPLDEAAPPAEQTSETLLALNEALTRFGVEEPEAVKIVELRYFDRQGGQRARRLPRDGQPPLGLRESLASWQAHD